MWVATQRSAAAEIIGRAHRCEWISRAASAGSAFGPAGGSYFGSRRSSVTVRAQINDRPAAWSAQQNQGRRACNCSGTAARAAKSYGPKAPCGG